MPEERYMRRAMELAARAAGYTNPNPMVGAVVVKDGRIIGEGYHRRIGELHAERNALAACTESVEGATIYVTLEPCCHYGKTPPCTEAIIEHKLAEVVIGSRDPNPKVAGKGAAMLRAAGIRVVEDYLREECDALNPVFLHYIRDKKPYVALKYAMTADGRIAAMTGNSQWITGEAARAHVQELRNYYSGIMVGIGTVLADDPMLTCRMSHPISADYGDERNASGMYGRNPVRIICDSHLQIPETSKLVNTTDQAPVIVACMREAESNRQRVKALEDKGVQLMFVPEKNGHIDICDLMSRLGEQGIDGIMVEGGGTLNASLVREGLVNRIYAYVGAQIVGGEGRYFPVGNAGIETMSDSWKLSAPKVQVFGNDILLEYECK